MTTLDARQPVKGPEYDKARPETRDAWLAFRRAGITATEVRDWGNGGRRRDIIEAKKTGHFADLSHVAAINHGNLREPKIAAWIEAKYGIAPCDNVFASPRNPRWLASPDGVSLDPLSSELIVGVPDAVLSEIKTSIHDLTPGRIDAEGVLLAVEPGSKFDTSGYYVQMQWQMLVMNAYRTLFVWEQRSPEIDPATGTFTIVGAPHAVWVNRDEPLIERLMSVAAGALEEIDKALGSDPAPVEVLDAETTALVVRYAESLRTETAAKKEKADAWAALQARYLSTGEVARPDVAIEVPGLGKITKSTSTKTVREFDEPGARKKAPALMSKYDALVERFTIESEVSTEKLTVTPAKEITK